MAISPSDTKALRKAPKATRKAMMWAAAAPLAMFSLAGAAHAEAPRMIDNPIPDFQPMGIRVDISREHADTIPIFAAGDEPLPIFMNRWGGTYYGGRDDGRSNQSSIVPGQSATVGGFGGSDAQWGEVMTCVTDLFSRFNVYVTDIEPTEGDFVESVVGGSPDQLGLPWGVGGVAPWDPYNCSTIANAVVYTFSDVYGNQPGSMRAICETAAQEIAHAFSVDHELLCTDPMTYLDGCGEKTFKDEYASCGEYEARVCNCERPNQNSVQLLYERLGASDGLPPPPPPEDFEIPTVSFVAPEDGETLLANSIITVQALASDDLGISGVTLEWDYSDNSMLCPGSGGSWECTRDGALHTWTINVGVGSRSFRVSVRDVAGKEALTETRTVWLGETIDEVAPNDTGAPLVFIASPTQGASMPADGEVTVVAEIIDDTGIAQAGLVWENDGQQRFFACPSDGQYVTCYQEGSTYIWNLRVSDGSRSFSVYAKDLVGNETLSEVFTFDLTSDLSLVGELDDFENNNTWDLAQPMTCGQSLDLKTSPADPDWFSIDAPKDQLVRVRVRGEAAENLSLVVSDGAGREPLNEESDGDILLSTDDGIRVGVRPTSSNQGDYELTVICLPNIDTLEIERQSCSNTGSPADHALLLSILGLLGFAVIRQRRHYRATFDMYGSDS